MAPTQTPTPVLSAEAQAFLTENHLCTFTTLRPDGSPHTAPVRFTWDKDTGLARVMTAVTRRKARNVLARPGSRVSVCQMVELALDHAGGHGDGLHRTGPCRGGRTPLHQAVLVAAAPAAGAGRHRDPGRPGARRLTRRGHAEPRGCRKRSFRHPPVSSRGSSGAPADTHTGDLTNLSEPCTGDRSASPVPSEY